MPDILRKRFAIVTLIAIVLCTALACSQSSQRPAGPAAGEPGDSGAPPMSCDDGSPTTCFNPDEAGDCSPREVVATIAGCPTCVDPATCAPEPEHVDAGSPSSADASTTDGCGDGTEVGCRALPPTCPRGTVVAVVRGCWTCADAETCAELGLPASCDDGSAPTCINPDEPEDCGAREVIAMVDGCPTCVDAFTCAHVPAGS